MIYNDRVILITEKEEGDFLGTKKVKVKSKPVACMRVSVKAERQALVFGGVDLSSFALHLQGNHPNVVAVIYKGVERAIKTKEFRRNHTILYL